MSVRPSVRMSIRPSVHKTFIQFQRNVVCRFVGRGRRVMHDGMQCDSIQGQGHEPLKVGNSAIFKGYLLPIYIGGWQVTSDS